MMMRRSPAGITFHRLCLWGITFHRLCLCSNGNANLYSYSLLFATDNASCVLAILSVKELVVFKV